mgnify:CR=1 FL=1
MFVYAIVRQLLAKWNFLLRKARIRIKIFSRKTIRYSSIWLIERNSQSHYLDCAAWPTFVRIILVFWGLFVSCLSRWSKLTLPTLISLSCQYRALFLFWNPTVLLYDPWKHSRENHRSDSIAHSWWQLENNNVKVNFLNRSKFLPEWTPSKVLINFDSRFSNILIFISQLPESIRFPSVWPTSIQIFDPYITD